MNLKSHVDRRGDAFKVTFGISYNMQGRFWRCDRQFQWSIVCLIHTRANSWPFSAYYNLYNAGYIHTAATFICLKGKFTQKWNKFWIFWHLFSKQLLVPIDFRRISFFFVAKTVVLCDSCNQSEPLPSLESHKSRSWNTWLISMAPDDILRSCEVKRLVCAWNWTLFTSLLSVIQSLRQMNHSSELVLFSELVSELWKQFDSDWRPMSRWSVYVFLLNTWIKGRNEHVISYGLCKKRSLYTLDTQNIYVSHHY